MRPDRRIGSDFSPARPNARQDASSWRQTAKCSLVVEIDRAAFANLVKCEIDGHRKIILAASVSFEQVTTGHDKGMRARSHRKRAALQAPRGPGEMRCRRRPDGAGRGWGPQKPRAASPAPAVEHVPGRLSVRRQPTHPRAARPATPGHSRRPFTPRLTRRRSRERGRLDHDPAGRAY